MADYNIPLAWQRDIATCGTYHHAYDRNKLWYDWTEVQREHALSRYDKALRKLEELINLYEEHAEYLGYNSSVWWFELTTMINIDLGEMYSPNEMFYLVEDAIAKEQKSFEEKFDELYAYLEEEGL